MYFELWDAETRNLLYDFDTLYEALRAARELVESNPGHYPAMLALAQVDDEQVTNWLGNGASLQPLLDSPVEPPARRAIS